MEKPAKVGLDDFLRAEGREGWGRLVGDASNCGALNMGRINVFKGLNRQWGMLDSEPGFVIRLKDGKVTTVKRFQDATAPIQLFDPKSGEKLNAGHEWLNWSRPRTVAREIFLPHSIGESPPPLFVELYEGEYCYNHWRGWPAPVAPVANNEALQIYFAVRDWLFDGQPKVSNWLECWVAHKLRNPAVKQPSIPILIGDEGCGKDTLGRFYTALFGAHGDDIPGSRLDSKFNGFMNNQLFVNVSELEDASPQFFKNLVSNKKEFIELKNINARTQLSYLQLFASTNGHTPYLLQAGDRRGGIFRVCKGKDKFAARIDTSLVAQIEKLIEQPQNLAGIYPYFISLNLTNYKPFEEPFHTSDKDDVIRQHRSDGEQFIVDVISDPDQGWAEYVDGGRERKRCDLAAVTDFAFLPGAPPSMMALIKDARGRGLTTIGKWLHDVLPRGTVNDGKPVRTRFGLRRLWPVRKADYWYCAPHDEIARHYNDEPERTSNVVPIRVKP